MDAEAMAKTRSILLTRVKTSNDNSNDDDNKNNNNRLYYL